jgi:hypothetical protein
LEDAQNAALDPHSRFPWAEATQHIPRDKRALQNEMRSRFSAPFSRAFAYPPGYQNIQAAQEAYQTLKEDMTTMLEAAS